MVTNMKKHTFTYKDSFGQTRIPMFSPVFKSWCRGNTKPFPYTAEWVWRLEISYIDLFGEVPRIIGMDFDYYHRDDAVQAREFIETNLEMDGVTVINSVIYLVAIRGLTHSI